MRERRAGGVGAGVNVFELGDGPPVVLLHGLLGSPAYMLPLARSLARGGRHVLVPELPGHGRSDPLRPFEFAAVADRLADAVAELGVERPALLGHSLGVPVAVHWALRRQVRSLVAASPVGVVPLDLRASRWLLPVAPLLACAARAGADRLAASTVGRRLVFGWFVGMARPQAVDAGMGAELIQAAAGAAPVVADVLVACEGLRLAEPAAALRIPTLVIWGDLDIHSDNGDRLAKALSGSTHVLTGCGHMPMLEAPYSFRRALDGWL